MYIFIYRCTYIYIDMDIDIDIDIDIGIHIHILSDTWVCVCVCMCIYIQTCDTAHVWCILYWMNATRLWACIYIYISSCSAKCMQCTKSVQYIIFIYMHIKYCTWEGGNESQRKQTRRAGVCEAAVVDVTCKRTCWASTTSTSEACANQQEIPITQTQHKIHIATTIATRKVQLASAAKLHGPIYVYISCFYLSHPLMCCS